jgi:hypothetical protein
MESDLETIIATSPETDIVCSDQYSDSAFSAPCDVEACSFGDNGVDDSDAETEVYISEKASRLSQRHKSLLSNYDLNEHFQRGHNGQFRVQRFLLPLKTLLADERIPLGNFENHSSSVALRDAARACLREDMFDYDDHLRQIQESAIPFFDALSDDPIESITEAKPNSALINRFVKALAANGQALVRICYASTKAYLLPKVFEQGCTAKTVQRIVARGESTGDETLVVFATIDVVAGERVEGLKVSTLLKRLGISRAPKRAESADITLPLFVLVHGTAAVGAEKRLPAIPLTRRVKRAVVDKKATIARQHRRLEHDHALDL